MPRHSTKRPKRTADSPLRLRREGMISTASSYGVRTSRSPFLPSRRDYERFRAASALRGAELGEPNYLPFMAHRFEAPPRGSRAQEVPTQPRRTRSALSEGRLVEAA